MYFLFTMNLKTVKKVSVWQHTIRTPRSISIEMAFEPQNILYFYHSGHTYIQGNLHHNVSNIIKKTRILIKLYFHKINSSSCVPEWSLSGFVFKHLCAMQSQIAPDIVQMKLGASSFTRQTSQRATLINRKWYTKRHDKWFYKR